MGFYLSKIISNFLLPPSSLIILLLVGVSLLKRHFIWGRRLIVASAAGLTLLSLPVVSMSLMSLVEPYPALSDTQIAQTQAQAIVVLGGGRNYNAAEYGGDTVSGYTLERIRYGAKLHRMTQLPVLVTGGTPLDIRVPEGELMADALQQDFNTKVKWKEIESRNTAENAQFSADILKRDDIKRILLVTQAWHMNRAVPLFINQGLETTAAPTAFEGFIEEPLEFLDFLPNPKAFLKSYYACHELLGTLWYKLRY